MRKPLERRELLEEAAGIAGFRTRIDAAGRKLEKTNDNLARLRDIISEVEKQVRMLSRQAKRAQQRSSLKEQLQHDELELFAVRSSMLLDKQDAAQAEQQMLAQKVQGVRHHCLSFAAQEEGLRSQLETVDVELSDLHRARDLVMQKISQRKALQSEARLEVAQIEGKIRVVESGFSRIDSRREAIAQQRSERLGSIAGLERKISTLAAELQAAEANLARVLKRRGLFRYVARS